MTWIAFFILITALLVVLTVAQYRIEAWWDRRKARKFNRSGRSIFTRGSF